MKKPSLKVSKVSNWAKTRQQKSRENEERERQAETSMLKLFTFAVTLAAMALAMSYLPLFPQPLPIFLAVLVAFITYQKPRLGMPIGGVIIGLGLLYQLSHLYFISFLGETPARVAFIAVWMALFIAVPLMFNRYKAALAIDFGIFAFVALFFAPLYFLAIPLIFASAVYFKKYVGLTAIYYVLLSVPLQIYQYYQYTVLPLSDIQSDWWTLSGSAPPLFVPLNQISADMTSSLTQFRLYDASNFIYDIAGQTTWVPNWNGVTIQAALTQYVDSVPGIIMFMVIVAGLAALLLFFSSMLIKGGFIGSGDRYFPCFQAVVAAALFFVLLDALQLPLAYSAEVGAIGMVMGILGTLLLTFPVMFMDYAPKRQATSQEVVDKAKALLDEVTGFSSQIQMVKESIPVVVSSPEGKTSVLLESIGDIHKRASLHLLDQRELDDKYDELDKLAKDREAIEAELGTILYEYQVFSSCEFANWAGKLKAAGLDIKTSVKAEYTKDMPLEQRVEAIRQIIEAGRELTREISAVAEPVYGIIQPLYDPALPPKSYAVQFAAEKVAKKEAPWIAVEALYNALNNWTRHYGSQIQETMAYLQRSIKPIVRLGNQPEVLPSVFGEGTHRVLGYAKNADGMSVTAQKRLEKDPSQLILQDVVGLKEDLDAFIAMSNDILTTLYNGLVSDEAAIDGLLPTKDYLWEKNSYLRQQLEVATLMLSDPSKYTINEVMAALPKYLGYLDEAVKTLAFYSERKEFLLNYPLAEAAINEKLKVKARLLPSDLPFHPRFAAEYLRLYYTTRFGEYMYDAEAAVLSRRPSNNF
ncbi:hypothetical protein GX563_00995 [Candidatus Bathyarchaeota archaeon]|nr:hypothetical protein [Candidatus Bathyarchaeota archaeon]